MEGIDRLFGWDQRRVEKLKVGKTCSTTVDDSLCQRLMVIKGMIDGTLVQAADDCSSSGRKCHSKLK